MARPAMKQPRTFSTGDPSYFVVASTSGSASPTVLTVAKVSTGVPRGRNDSLSGHLSMNTLFED